MADEVCKIHDSVVFYDLILDYWIQKYPWGYNHLLFITLQPHMLYINNIYSWYPSPTKLLWLCSVPIYIIIYHCLGYMEGFLLYQDADYVWHIKLATLVWQMSASSVKIEACRAPFVIRNMFNPGMENQLHTSWNVRFNYLYRHYGVAARVWYAYVINWIYVGKSPPPPPPPTHTHTQKKKKQKKTRLCIIFHSDKRNCDQSVTCMSELHYLFNPGCIIKSSECLNI